MQIHEAIEKALAKPAGPVSGPPTDNQLGEILKAARLAPSAYNMQPWHFQVLVSPDHRKEVGETFALPWDPRDRPPWILCLMDRDRMLPVADPLGTETYIALGMAGLNIQVASVAQGLTCQVWGPFASSEPSRRPKTFSFAPNLEPYFAFIIGEGGKLGVSPGPIPAVYRVDSFQSEPRRVNPPPHAGPGMDALRCVRLRRIDREALRRGDPWEEDCLRILSVGRRALEAHRATQVELLLVEKDEKTMELTRLQEKAWHKAMTNRGRFAEVCDWLRFTHKEWQKKGDGELVHHFGLGGLKRALARLGLRTGLAPLAMTWGAGRLFMRRGQPSPQTTGAFLTTVLEDPKGRFPSDDLYRRRVLTGVGACLQAIWLTATALGASLQFQTSSIVVEDARAELRRALRVPETHDLLSLIRMGYPIREMDYRSVRRDPREISSRTS